MQAVGWWSVGLKARHGDPRQDISQDIQRSWNRGRLSPSPSVTLVSRGFSPRTSNTTRLRRRSGFALHKESCHVTQPPALLTRNATTCCSDPANGHVPTRQQVEGIGKH
jgi:hypothetical protein